MAPTSSPFESFARGLSRAFGAVLGLVLALAGFVLMLGALAVGLTAALGLAAWALLRGRRPTVQTFRWRGAGWPAGAFGRMDAPTGRPRGPRGPSEVVDVEVTEVREPPNPTIRREP